MPLTSTPLSPRTQLLAIVGGCGLLLAGALLILWRSYEAELEVHRGVLSARAETTLDALIAGLRAQTRMGRYRGDRLSAIFDELTGTEDLLAVSLEDSEGTLVASAGDTAEANVSGGAGLHWHPARLVARRLVSLASGTHGRGRGMADPSSSTWSAAPYVVTVVFDTRHVEELDRQDRILFLVSAGIACAGAVLAGVAGWTLLRQGALRTELAVATERVAYHERLTQLGAGLAHETKNPLGIIRGLAQASAKRSEEERAECLQQIVDETDRIVGQIDSFLALARPRDARKTRLPLPEFFERFQPVLEIEAEGAGVRWTCNTVDATIEADEEFLRRMLLNLVSNACKASELGGEVRLRASRGDDRITLCVEDDGCGIAPGDLERIREPYFTRFPGGTGLGLSMVEQMASSQGWRVEIESTLHRGTRACIKGIEEVFG